jgi:hypothetical protein
MCYSDQGHTTPPRELWSIVRVTDVWKDSFFRFGRERRYKPAKRNFRSAGTKGEPEQIFEKFALYLHTEERLAFGEMYG